MTMRRWVKQSVLGMGSFGTVSLAVPSSSSDHHDFNTAMDDQVVAVKSADVGSATSLLVEGRFLHKFRGCPEIVRCFGEDISVEDDEETYNLLLEYAPGGTLETLINDVGSGLPEIDVSCYAYMILKGLSYIHERGYVHCDIKPANILMFPISTGFNDGVIKIADFGLAKKFGALRAPGPSGSCSVVKKLRDNVRGTALYNSPESVLLGHHEAPMDVWALGVTMINMLTGGESGYLDYENKDDLVSQIAFEEDLPELPVDSCISKEAREFVLMCLIRDPKQRWTADKLLQHPFITRNSFTPFCYALGTSGKASSMNPLGVPTDKWFSSRSLFSTQPLLPPPLAPNCYLPHQMFRRNQASPMHV